MRQDGRGARRTIQAECGSRFNLESRLTKKILVATNAGNGKSTPGPRMDRSNEKDAGPKARAPARLAPANLADRHLRGDAALRAALRHRLAAIAAEHARAARVVHAVARIDRDTASPLDSRGGETRHREAAAASATRALPPQSSFPRRPSCRR